MGTGDNCAESPGRFARRVQPVDGHLDLTSIDDGYHAHSAVERAPHFARLNIAFGLQPLEHGRQVPAISLDFG